MANATIEEAADKVASAPPAKELEHLDGCPALRIERYDQTRPADDQVMTTTRCIDCGSQRADPTGRFNQKERTDA